MPALAAAPPELLINQNSSWVCSTVKYMLRILRTSYIRRHAALRSTSSKSASGGADLPSAHRHHTSQLAEPNVGSVKPRARPCHFSPTRQIDLQWQRQAEARMRWNVRSLALFCGSLLGQKPCQTEGRVDRPGPSREAGSAGSSRRRRQRGRRHAPTKEAGQQGPLEMR